MKGFAWFGFCVGNFGGGFLFCTLLVYVSCVFLWGKILLISLLQYVQHISSNVTFNPNILDSIKLLFFMVIESSNVRSLLFLVFCYVNTYWMVLFFF
jgi:hypothetical protein